MFPLAQFRSDTPGCAQLIHFNNAGCSLHPKPVVDAVRQFLEEESLTGGYELAAARAKELDDLYHAGAAVLHAEPHNIAFVNSATDGFSKALSSIAFREGDVILTTINDYVSSQIQFIALEKRFGVRIVRARDAASGEADPDEIRSCIKKHRPALVSITHVPNNTGMVQPIEEIGRICAEEDIPYFVDACQSAGQLPLDVTRIQCDFLTFSMRKFMRGPRGAGLLYVSNKALERGAMPMLPDMRGADWIDAHTFTPMPDARRFEYVEQSYALILGSAVAMRYYLQAGSDAITLRNAELCDHLRKGLSEFAHIRLMDKGSKLSSIITFVSDRTAPTAFRDVLVKHGINCGAAPKKFALLDLEAKQVDGIVRISPHYYNTIEEINTMLQVIRDTGI